MGKMNFYVLWSLRDAPRQFIRCDFRYRAAVNRENSNSLTRASNIFVYFIFGSKSNRRCFQVHVPLPLPKQLVIFGLGEWRGGASTTVSVEVVVSTEVRAQRIGTLSSQARYEEDFKKRKNVDEHDLRSHSVNSGV